MLQNLVASYADFGMLMRDIDVPGFDGVTGKCVATTIIQKAGTSGALTIFDKLAMTHTINDMIKSPNTQSPTTTTTTTAITTAITTATIINHSLSYSKIIEAYECKHTVLFNNKVCVPEPYDMYHCKNDKYDIYMRQLAQAIANGLYVHKLIGGYTIQHNNPTQQPTQTSPSKLTSIKNSICTLYEIFAPESYVPIDTKLERCTSVKYLDAHSNATITTCSPFAKSLRTLIASQSQYKTSTCGLKDTGIKLCTSLELLDASYNNKITSCTPFANSLRILFANGYECGIEDGGLKMCKNITELHADNNVCITTCAPFAKTLRILSVCVDDRCDYIIMSDKGISMCNNIEELYANNNTEITTCDPFAKTLHILFAKDICGITDYGLQSCASITMLNASFNTKITTCESFGKSLRKLSISQPPLLLTVESFKSCTFVTELNIAYSTMRTTNVLKFAPLAKTLKKLTYGDHGDIDLDSLNSCTSLTEFDASHILTLIKCDSFAKTLRKLTINSYTQIRDDGLRLCNTIEHFCAGGNPYITTCAPFAKSLRTLSAQLCMIGDSGLTLCASITNLDAMGNPRITTCAPFAKSLRVLVAAGHCGITDAGLQLCASITELDASNNLKITTCDPFIRTIRRLTVRYNTKFSQEKISQILQKNNAVIIVNNSSRV